MQDHLQHLSDEELVKKARSKDKQAFAALFDRYNGKIVGYLSRYVGDHQKAEDITVETFLSVYNNLDVYKEEGKFSSWLYKIATNFAKKELQRTIRRREVSLDMPLDNAEAINFIDLIEDAKSKTDDQVIQSELKGIIYKIVSRLDDKYKEVLLLCDVEGVSNQEAAKVLKCNIVTLGTRLRRARKQLYDILKKYGYKFEG